MKGYDIDPRSTVRASCSLLCVQRLAAHSVPILQNASYNVTMEVRAQPGDVHLVCSGWHQLKVETRPRPHRPSQPPGASPYVPVWVAETCTEGYDRCVYENTWRWSCNHSFNLEGLFYSSKRRLLHTTILSNIGIVVSYLPYNIWRPVLGEREIAK